MTRLTVILTCEEEARFEAYCRINAYKKSTLVARLIREHMDREGFEQQISLLPIDASGDRAHGQQLEGKKSI